MKKVLIGIGVFLLLIVIGIFFLFPQILFIFPFTQKWALELEGEQAATFYFKNEAKDSLYMKGVIYSNTYNELTKVLQENSSITTLVMEEVPGSIDDEVNLIASKEIRKHNLNTYIPNNGWVASGGTDMFLAGVQRNIALNARLGVHSWAGLDKVAKDFPKDAEEHKKYLNYYKEMDIPTDFYWYTLDAAPAESIHWMTPLEINKYDVVTPTLDLSELLATQKQLASDEFAGRAVGKNQKAQKLIRNRFQQIGLQSFSENYEQPFTFQNEKTKRTVNATNLIGYIKGKKYPNHYIVIGAHYDHVGIIKDTIYNGADDNASGTSALLTLAKYFSKKIPDHSIIFAAFDAEESGLWGSKYFVDNPPVSLKDIQLNINFDMISRNPKNEIYAVGTYQYPKFKVAIDSVAKYVPFLQVSFGHDNPNDTTKDFWMRSSDNGPFFEKNIPNITFSEEDHPGYHHHSDDFENTNPEFYKNVVILIKNTIQQIDQNILD
ncbi:M28 family peptidase [Tenacibaculum amylolyticum]|uniref:M28 family peptidase n=1 Tax=Tenacibaculum amylolyticum TaxID=104269 RepID=UPI0038941047